MLLDASRPCAGTLNARRLLDAECYDCLRIRHQGDYITPTRGLVDGVSVCLDRRSAGTVGDVIEQVVGVHADTMRAFGASRAPMSRGADADGVPNGGDAKP